MATTRSLPSTSAATSLPLIVALCAAAILGAALWLQQQGNAPCPLCILQRIAYLGVLASAVFSALTAFAGQRLVSRVLAVLGVLCALGGFVVAAKHIWLVWHPGQTCGLDPLAATINHWPITHWAPWMFRADGLCADVPYMLGVALPVWSALGFVALSLLLLLSMHRGKGAHGPTS